MNIKYKPIRASDNKQQLVRIEKKTDRILELLEGKELSVSYEDNIGHITVPAERVTYRSLFSCLLK